MVVASLVRERPFELAVEVADGHDAAAAHIGAVGLGAHARHCDIVLIGNVADDLLQNVLQRHQPHQRAVFVHDKGEMLPPAPEGVQLVEQGWSGPG